MKIRLKEILQDGRAYDFNQESGELNDDLRDLIGDRKYKVSLFIKPIGNAYEMRGSVLANVAEVCSTCGYDFEQPIERKVNEILFEEQDDHRKSHSVHGNQSVEFESSGPSMTPIKGEIFDASAYVHEAIALEEPFYPVCGPNGQCLHKQEVDEIQRKLAADFALADEKTAGHPAFEVLKGLKV